MRISDWSSDVCSSDLLRALQPPCLSQSAPCASADQRECGGLSLQSPCLAWSTCAAWLAINLLHHHERAGTGAWVRWGQGDHRPDAGAHPRRCRGDLQSGGLYAAPARDRTGVGRSAAQGHAARSEEHTTELQSLMRISYAVFYLKKKKIETK